MSTNKEYVSFIDNVLILITTCFEVIINYIYHYYYYYYYISH